MKRLVSTICHVGVIGLALLALMIATAVWLFERACDRDSGRPPVDHPEMAGVPGLAKDELGGSVRLRYEDKASAKGARR